jgi:sporulation protein YlmC with PRC-barrel domain
MRGAERRVAPFITQVIAVDFRSRGPDFQEGYMTRLNMRRTMPAVASALGIAFAGGAVAAIAGNGSAAQQAAQQPMAPQDIRISRLLGMKVEDSAGHRVGEVADLIVDAGEGKVRYAVVDAGGFLGLGEHRTALPIASVRASLDKDRIVVDASREELKKYPSYPPGARHDWNDAAFRGRVEGTAPAPSAEAGSAAATRFYRASDLLDADLKDAAGTDIGDVEDIVMSLRDGRIRYGVAELDAAWGQRDKLVVMMPDDVRAEDGFGNDLVVTASAEKLRAAPAFDRGQWPDLNDRGFVSRLFGDRDGDGGGRMAMR